jgi:glycosyltransferase involved in cell wall biosynthesis
VTVALDATYSLGAALSGVGVYSSRLIEALLEAAPEWRFLLCYRVHRFFRSRSRPPARRVLLQEPLNVLLPRRAALFHGLNQRLPRYRFRRSVATFHDLFVMTAEYSSSDFRQRFTALAREAAERADALIAVSGHTARQVEELLGVDRRRIRVIYHGVDPPDEAAPAERGRPFLLHVGAVQTRKNILRLLEAFAHAPRELELVLAGSEGYGAEAIRQRAAENPRIRLLGYVARERLEELYRTAEALVFPSLDEGFGIPVLEAMAAGLPVVTSNRGATAEVAGEAALLVDPLDVAGLAAAIERVVQDRELRMDLIRRGRERAAQFTWERAARETLKLYRELL